MFLCELRPFCLCLFSISSVFFLSCSSLFLEFPKHISIMSSIASSGSAKFSSSSCLISGYGCKCSSLLGNGTENFLEMLWRTQQALTMRATGLRLSTSTAPRLCKHRKRVFKQPKTCWEDFQTCEWEELKRLAASALIREPFTGLSTNLALDRPLPPAGIKMRDRSEIIAFFDIRGLKQYMFLFVCLNSLLS